MPFAGTYTLTGKLSHLQDLRGVASIDEAYNYLDNYFNKNKNFTDVKSIKINTDQIFDFSINEQSKPYSIINLSEYKEYIKNILLKKKLDYETDESVSFEEIYELSKKAYVRFLDKQLLNNIDLKTDIYINVKDKHIKLSHSNKKLEVVLRDEIKMGLNCVIYKTDIRLLRSLLSGPKYAHWDNAEIGSHINFSRYPDIYEREVYGNMCYFHA
jgi:UDP-MurNAc hydroxylase